MEKESFDQTYLFLLIPNDSGSTWLQNVISQCVNCVSFKTGLDGKGVCLRAVHGNIYPNMKINKLFSEKRELWEMPGRYNWPEIKKEWGVAWSQDVHYFTTGPKVFLEKTPQAIYASDMYVENFDNVRFLVMTRNPYAVSEGIRRTVKNVSIQRCARHWVRCAQRQIYNYAVYKDISVETTYEELVSDPRTVEYRIKNLIPALHDIDLTKPASAHALDGGVRSRPLLDYNARQIENLSAEDIAIVNKELRRVPAVLKYFGYEIIDK